MPWSAACWRRWAAVQCCARPRSTSAGLPVQGAIRAKKELLSPELSREQGRRLRNPDILRYRCSLLFLELPLPTAVLDALGYRVGYSAGCRAVGTELLLLCHCPSQGPSRAVLQGFHISSPWRWLAHLCELSSGPLGAPGQVFC